jgi:hypothetical protein
MKRLRRLAGLLLPAITAFATTHTASASAQVAYSNSAQAPDNAAGVVFHPRGDLFEIWDNRKDGIPVQVWYRYANRSDWHRIVSHVHYHAYRRDMKEYPYQVVFLIDGHDNRGKFVRSAPSRYRTSGL